MIGAPPLAVPTGWLHFKINIISGNAASGILISGGSAGNLVKGNFLGLDYTGNKALPNNVSGIVISGSTANTIGGTGTGAANTISGNQLNGVQLASGANTNLIQGNLIGTNAGGNATVGNTAEGVLLDDVSLNTISSNTISGNDANGVRIFGTGSMFNQVYANMIGVSAATSGTGAGTVPDLGNLGNGVLLDNAGPNTIGGSASGYGNTISGNLQSGVFLLSFLLSSQQTGYSVVEGNYIGTTADGEHAAPNGGNGILIDGSISNTIGGFTTKPGRAPGNVISGNCRRPEWPSSVPRTRHRRHSTSSSET